MDVPLSFGMFRLAFLWVLIVVYGCDSDPVGDNTPHLSASITAAENLAFTFSWNAKNCPNGEFNLRSVDPPGDWILKIPYPLGTSSGSHTVDYYDISKNEYEIKLTFCGVERSLSVNGLRVPPPILTTTIEANGVRLRWNDVTQGRTHYIIERRPLHNPDFIAYPPGTTSVLDNGVASGMTYTYCVRSIRTPECSNRVTVTIPDQY